MSLTWKLEQRPISSLKEYERNPRKLTRKGLKQLRESITKFGVAEPICITVDGTIIGGHGRKKALTQLKIKNVDCYIASRELTDDEFKELNVRLNKNIAGEFDTKMLLEDFSTDELIDIGFEAGELELPEVDEKSPDGGTDSGLEREIIHCPACGHQFYDDE